MFTVHLICLNEHVKAYKTVIFYLMIILDACHIYASKHYPQEPKVSSFIKLKRISLRTWIASVREIVMSRETMQCYIIVSEQNMITPTQIQ